MARLGARLGAGTCALVAVLLAASEARADKVAVLPFASAPSASAEARVDTPELERARAWTKAALVASGHVLPNESEQLSAEMAVKDGVADTSDECRAAGRASGSPWTLTGRLERSVTSALPGTPPGTSPGTQTNTPAGGAAPTSGASASSAQASPSYRLELEACQVGTGRVESLARTVHPAAAESEVREMVALLVRPEGIANAEIPWNDDAPPLPQAPPPEAPLPTSPPQAPPPAEPAPAVAHAYAEGHPLALGLSLGVSGALVRPGSARGSTAALPIGGALGYAIESVPGLELRGVFDVNVAGPRALEAAAGARYMLGVLPQHRFFVGPELVAGALVTLGASKDGRFLTRGSAVASLGVGERVQLELAGDLAGAFGGAGTLVLGGATARALVRF